ARGCAASRLGDGVGLDDGVRLDDGVGLDDGDGLTGAPSTLTRAGAEGSALVPPGWAAWLAVERAASSPLAAQLMVGSNPMPTAGRIPRRRQYVAGETLVGRGRAPRGGSAFGRRFWSIELTMEDSHRKSLKARRKVAPSTPASAGPLPPVRGAAAP